MDDVAPLGTDWGAIDAMRLTELRYQDPATQTYLGSPSIVRLSNGELLATFDYFGPGAPLNRRGAYHLTSVYRSSDNGETWKSITHISNCFWSSLFVLGDTVYLIGTTHEYGSIVVRRSENSGNTWSHPGDRTNGLLFPCGVSRNPPNYHCAPVPVLIRNGRLFRAFEDFAPTDQKRNWWAPGFLSCVISCPVDADLLHGDSWTMSNKLRFDPAWIPAEWGELEAPGWLEGNIVAGPGGDLVNVIRFNSKPLWDRAAIIQVSEDGSNLSFDPQTGFIDFPGGITKFTVRFDEQTQRYFTLSNGNINPAEPTNRSVLSLYASDDLRSWQHLDIVLQDDLCASVDEAYRQTGFQYVDWQFDGDDIIALVRTSYDGAHNFHDSNRITFHRLTNFRRRAATFERTGRKPSPGAAEVG